MRRVFAVVIGEVTFLILAVDGSRNLWIAFLVATLSVVAPPVVRRVGITRRKGVWASAVAGGLVLISIPTGLLAAVLERLTNFSNVGFRLAMWEPLTGAWLSRPLVGFGPGSFPWVLQRTAYFDSNSYAPRHPDSAIFQLLPEAGVLGVLAAGIVLAVIVPRLFSGRSLAARWALIAGLVSGLAANPTDFGYLVIILVGWVGLALPNDTVARDLEPMRGARRLASWAIVGCGLVVGAASGATLLASVLYDQGREAISAGAMVEARAHIDGAIAFDPGMALYRRQRGVIALVTGDTGGAEADLRQAAVMNETDDLAWRTLALAQLAAGDRQGAIGSIGRAVGVHRSNPANLLILATLERETGHVGNAKSTLAEVVQAWPSIVYAPGWSSFLGSDIGTGEVVDLATQRWLDGLQAPEATGGQLLILLAGNTHSDLQDRAVAASGLGGELGNATIAAATCTDPAAALNRVSPAGKRLLQYWQLRIRVAALEGMRDEAAVSLVEAWGARPSVSEWPEAALNPLNEDEAHGFSTDTWGYRRQPVDWNTFALRLPAPSAGSARWLLDPRTASRESGLGERISRCR
jgi:tetratricopeptide (TPR) repeat protein